MTDEQQERRASTGIAGLFAITVLLAGGDMITDIGEGTSTFHLAMEGSVVVVGLLGILVMGRRFLSLQRRQRALEAEAASLIGQLESTRDDAERWRQEAASHLRGLGASIDEQLTRWKLTPAEKEVAMLLLKGLSLKETGDVREVSEATVRQQARAVYRKAGLSGRSELSAFFLEDLLLPPQSLQASAETDA